MSATAETKRSVSTPRRPERKWGPFAAGVGVCVWLNQVKTDDGQKYFRSVTINPRRYREEESGEWRDSGSLRATDLSSLILGLEAAREFIANTPLPGESAEEEPTDEPVAPADETAPF